MHGPLPARAGVAGALEASLAGLLAGTGLQMVQPVLWPAGVYAALLAAAVAATLVARRRLRGSARGLVPVLLALAAALAGAGLTGMRAIAYQADALAPALEGRDLVVTGIVSEMPQFNDAGVRLRLAVESATLAGATVQVPDRLALGWYAGHLAPAADGLLPELQRQPVPVRAGERWRFTVRLKAPHGNSNPGGFDYELWLWEQGVQATGYVRASASDPPAQNLGPTGRYRVESARQDLRDRLLVHLEGRREAGLVAALVVGDQNAIDRADWDVFRATGVAHLVSISGLHVTLFAWLAAAAIGSLWRRSARLCLWIPAPHAARIGGLVAAAAYALFSGWGVPAQRTVWMLAAVAVLRLSARHWPWPAVWLLVGGVVVLADPWALTQAGFWLSFVAVGVLFASDPGPGSARGVGARLLVLLREQLVVTVALAPLTLLLFGQVSLVGLVANLFAIPWVTLVVTPLALLGAALPPAWDAAAAGLAVLGAWLQWLALWPLAAVSLPQAPWWAGMAGVAGGLLLVLRAPWSLRLLGLPLVLPAMLWQPARPAPGDFWLLAADIGQGNAVLVRTASHALLYDAGPQYSRESDAGHRVLLPLLRSLGVQPDLLVLSHRDTDHAGGAASVLQAHPAMALSSSIGEDHALQALRPVQRCEAGQRWTWDGVVFTVLHPAVADYAGPARPNAMSCVLRISSQPKGPGTPGRVALLAGDIERPQELRLRDQGVDLRADLLLVPHHGSRTSSSAELLDAVAPRWALVQAGYRNRFGHPAREPMQRYQERHIAVLDSPHCGAALWRSEIPDRVRCERVESRRYWHHVAP